MEKQQIFTTTRRVVLGNGSIHSIKGELDRLEVSSVLIVTDPGLVAAGIVDILEKILAKDQITFARFDQVEADPPMEQAAQVVEKFKASGAQAIIGIGGGSSLDIAKIVSVMVTNNMPVTEMFGSELVKKPGVPLILIPTTAGTGSEVTPIVILSDNKEKLKKGVVSSYLYPACALLDPELTLGLPPAITAATGMDALIHALEAYTSVNATPISDTLAIEAIRTIYGSIRTAFSNGQNIEARSAMLRGSMLAGMAFANAGVTAVHAFAYPIGSEFHIPHGIANTIMLIPVMQFNCIGNLDRFARLPEFMGSNTQGMSKRKAADVAVQALIELAEDLRVPRHLRDFGVREEHIPELAEGVLKVTRLLANNPRRLELEDAKAIYRAAL